MRSKAVVCRITYKDLTHVQSTSQLKVIIVSIETALWWSRGQIDSLLPSAEARL